MKKQIIAAISAHPVRAAFLLILLFLLGSVMHQALGQGNTGNRSMAANISQAVPPSSGAVAETYAPAQPAPNIVAPAEPSQATSMWTVATPYPTTIVRYGFAQTATHAYVFGGVSDGTRLNTVNRMDFATGVWQPRAAMPFTSEAPTCALMASTGIVYCTEGDTGSGFASYNIATDSWTPLASIPGGDHYGSASGAFNGKVFVAGGTTAFTNAVQVYTVATNTWAPGTAAPNDFLFAGYQQVGQYLYVAGGLEAGGPNQVAAGQSSVLRKGRPNQPAVPSANNATTLRLDMSSAPGVWSTGPAFTPARADFGLAYDAGTNKLYAMGGDATGGGFFDSTNLVDELSVASWPAGSWAASPDNLILPNRQANQAGFYGAGQIWSVGGIVGQTFQFLAEVQRRSNGGGGGCSNYTTTTSTGSITPGSTDSGNHCDDCATAITFPFPVSVYGQTFNSANVASNGALDLIGTQAPFTHGCQVLPNTLWTMAIFPYQDDLRTDQFSGCAGFPGGTCGVFTSVTGTAPNRHFNIEWRAVHFADTTTSANFEVVFSENQSSFFDVIYGATSDNGLDETSGVQASSTGPATTFSCGTATLTNGLKVTYTCAGGGGCTPAWQNEPPLANARRNAATVAVGSNLYAITGFNLAPDYSTANERFNGTTWTALAPIPVPHAQSRGTAVGTNIYVPGGFNSVSFGGPLDTMQIYNTTTNIWSAGMTLPAARSGVATAAFNGLVYVIAGYNPTGTGHNEVYIYNPGTNSYTTGAPMTATQGNVAGVLFNGEIYVVGGGTAPGAQYAYNPTTNAWRTIAPLPTTGGTCQSDNGFVLDNELWVVGCLGLAINQQVWIYNPGSNSWRAGPPYTVDHQGPGAALFNGRGFAVGGGTAGGGSTAVESVNGCAAPCPLRVLIASADVGGPPTTLQNQILAEPGVTAVDLFDAFSGTPTLAQLSTYDVVVAFCNNAYADATAMGNVLADYADTGGVVVAFNFDWHVAPFNLAGRWMTGGYTPFNADAPTLFTDSTLGAFTAGHPLMQGVTTLNGHFRHTVALASGATQVAAWADGVPLIAVKNQAGHTGIGINNYVGENPNQWSGEFGRVVVNAAHWLGGSCGPVPSSAVSRKVHGAFTGDINLPLVAIGGAVGIECRNGAGGYQMVVTFPNPVTVGGVSVTSGTGNVGSSSVSGGVVTINLTGVTDTQRLGVTLANVNDGTSTGDVLVPMGVLIGDSAGTGNGSVNAGDVGFVKSVSGQTAGAGNFRADIAINGTINASDVGLVKANSGHLLPP